MDLSIVIVDYKSKTFLKDCIDSINKTIVDLKYEIIVEDSTDGRSYTKAQNDGFKKAKGKVILSLNPDTLFKDGSINGMYSALTTIPWIDCIAPKFLNFDGSPQSNGHRFPTLTWQIFELLFINYLYPNNISNLNRRYYDNMKLSSVVEASSLACLMFRNKGWMLDEGYFMYYEDTDFCKNKTVFFHSDYTVYHYGGGSKSKKKDKYMYESMIHYFWKWHGFIPAFILINVLYVRMAVKWIKSGIAKQLEKIQD